MKTRDTLFKNMLDWRKYRDLMVCCTTSSSELNLGAMMANELGIPSNAYSILDVKEVSLYENARPLRMVKLRNTWGRSEWLG
jgi:hypothetical protein